MLPLNEFFGEWQKYIQLPFLQAVAGHDICAAQLLIVLGQQQPTHYLIHDRGWDSWFVVNDYNTKACVNSLRNLVAIGPRSLYRIKNVPSEVSVDLPKIISGEMEAVNVQVWRDWRGPDFNANRRLSKNFLTMCEKYPLVLDNFSTRDFNLFIEINPQVDDVAPTMFVQDWFVFARQGDSLVAVNCFLESPEYGKLLYAMQSDREACNISIVYSTIEKFESVLRQCNDLHFQSLHTILNWLYTGSDNSDSGIVD